MPLSNVSKLPDPRVQTGAAPAYRPPVPSGAPAEVPNLRDFRSPAEEFARRARVPPAAADLGARLRAMPAADMSGVAERLAPKAAGFGLGAFARGAAALAGPVVGGAQMLMHSGSLNSGEDAELARLRSQSPTIDPPQSLGMTGYADGGMITPEDNARELRTMMSRRHEGLARAPGYGLDGKTVGQIIDDTSRDRVLASGINATLNPGTLDSIIQSVAGKPKLPGYANGGMIDEEEEKRLAYAYGAVPVAQQPDGPGTAAVRSAVPARDPSRMLKASGGFAQAVAGGEVDPMKQEGGATGSWEAPAAPTPQQIERMVSPASPRATPQQIERQAGFWQEPAALRPTPFEAAAAARSRPGRAAAPSGEPGGMLPQAEPRDEAGFERLLADAQAGRQITTPRQRIGGMDLDAQSEAINAEGRADLGPGGYLMPLGTPYIDLAKGNADPEWRKRFDDRQARQNAISDQRADRDQMPIVIKDGLARVGMGTSAPADVYWNAEQAGGRGRAALDNYAGRMGQVRDTQFDEAINPGQREQGYKMAQIGAQGENTARVADITGAAHVYGTRVMADGSVDAATAKAQAAAAKDARKPLPEAGRKELLDIGTAAETSKRLLDTFKPEYGGNYILGDLDNTGRRMLGDKSGQASWWQALDLQQAEARHKLFGSALTKTELPNWEKTAILPRMSSEEIIKNLTRRAEIEARVVAKLARSYVAGGYNRAEIAELLGPTGAKYLEQAAPEVGAGGAASAGKARLPAVQTFNRNGQQVQARLGRDGAYYVPRPGAPGKFDKWED